ncbi:L-selectin-like [Boleophthalmus pectinirostris]|uniref:L-selectin-like n=1 Tax=Boleophthalmus pectinirostris TaxID=150288 RepID=UPI000A1C42E5|nr:L-selectin-like [Boleophthalmus pectinirostris]
MARYTESGVTYIYDATLRIWSAALAYCRQYYTDLAMIEDSATYDKVVQSRPSVNTWIGLSRQAWVWANGSLLTVNNWQGGKPTGNGTQFCVTEEETTHQWKTDVCENLNPFICHKAYKELMNKVKVTLQSSPNLENPTLHIQILQKLVEALRASGYHIYKVEWSINPWIQR